MRGRTVVLVTSFLFLISALGQADFKYTQSGQVTGGRGMPVFDTGVTETTTYVKGAYLRIDLPNGSYGIVDLNGHREIQVDPKSRTYSVISFDQVRAKNQAESEASRRSQPKNTGSAMWPKLVLTSTGRKRVFFGQTAQELNGKFADNSVEGANPQTQNGPPFEIETWIASSVPAFEEVKDFYAKLAAAIGWRAPDSDVSTGPALTSQKGVVEILIASEAAAYRDPVWVPVMAKGLLNLYRTAEIPIGLPILQKFSERAPLAQERQAAVRGNQQPRPAADETAPKSSAPGSSTNGALLAEFTFRVTSYTADTLDESLFQVPSGYVQLQTDMRQMWILAIGQE
jgi:hypothetical protein